MKKRNPIAEDLRTPKYKKRVIKPRKGKGSFKRKKKVILLKFSGAAKPEMNPLNLIQIMLAEEENI